MTSLHQTTLPADWRELLRGVPSYHFEPSFAQRVQRALAEFAPDCVALEIPTNALLELMWAVEEWPASCASIAAKVVFPFVPGDSILEAARLAVAQGISIVGVDLEVTQAQAEEKRPEKQSLSVDARWLERLGDGWDEMLGEEWPASESDLAREGHMAARLAGLLARGRKVLWVGGAAHWRRILGRLENGDFETLTTGTPGNRSFRRAYVNASALYFLTGKVPRQTEKYGADPSRYDEGEMLREAATLALERDEAQAGSPVVVLGEGVRSDPVIELLQEESHAAVDGARVLVYARNLAATRALESTPSVGELLRAATMVIGPLYGGRLFDLLTSEKAQQSNSLPTLSYEARGKWQGLWLGDEPISVHPYWPAPRSGEELWLLRPVPPELHDYASLYPSGPGEDRRSWLCHPDDRVCYRDFVRTLFRIVAQLAEPEHKAVPFSSGLGDGIDVRATLRGMYNDEIWIKEVTSTPQRITNGVIDWDNTSEFCPFLQGQEESGWIDPSEIFSFGSCSRVVSSAHSILSRQPHVQLEHRRWSLLTLDKGNTSADQVSPSFYDEVIGPLVHLQTTKKDKDNLYDWLNVMFRFCARKPFAYVSRYTPSQRIYRLAARHRVKLVHIPLTKIPSTLRQRNAYFRFMTVPRDDWNRVMTYNSINGI